MCVLSRILASLFFALLTALLLGVRFDKTSEAEAAFACPVVSPRGSDVYRISPSGAGYSIGVSVPLTTPTPTATPLCNRYGFTETKGTIVQGVIDTGNHCDDCYTTLVFPFPVRLYENTFTQAQVGSNGVLVFGSTPGYFPSYYCQPIFGATYTIFPYWDDLRTDTAGSGIYTLLSGSAPNRQFYIEWRATTFAGGLRVNFHVHFSELAPGLFDIVYSSVPSEIPVGVQRDNTNFSWHWCSGGGPRPGVRLVAAVGSCATSTVTHTPTSVSTPLPATFTPASTHTPTQSPSSTATQCPTGWAVMISPEVDADQIIISGVAALSAVDVWLVGVQNRGTSSERLIQHWDGTALSVVNAPTGNIILESVDANATNDVWAVGNRIMHWDGNNWNLVSFPNPTNSIIRFQDVEVLSINDVWAVGEAYSYPSTTEFVIQRWDGTQWRQVSVPTAGMGGSLKAVSASASGDVWAIGYSIAQTGEHQPLVLHWDGSVWREVPVPALGLQPTLRSVAAVSPSEAWIVGDEYDAPARRHTPVVLRWNGAVWGRVSAPEVGTFGVGLSDVIYSSETGVWVVGGYNNNWVQPLVARWNGTDWIREPVPEITERYAAPRAASAAGDGTLWAAGDLQFSRSLLLGRIPRCATPTPTPIACSITFSDVSTSDPFYSHIRCLACRYIISGYADGTFRSGNNITRGQIAKITSSAAGLLSDAGTQIYEDVPPTHTFYVWINRLSRRGAMSGYPCGALGEPCGPQGRPYFRSGANATRGQIAQIAGYAAGFWWGVTGQTFEDVPPSNPFYEWIQRLSERGIMGGYPCGGAGEPCGPERRPYFRWERNATRAQTSKIVANTFFPDCSGR